MTNEHPVKVLLSAKRDGGTISLRVDLDSLLDGPPLEMPVGDLILFGLEGSEELFPRLVENVDRALDYTVHKDGEDKRIRFRLAENSDWEEFQCAGIIEVSSEYTLVDWTQKCRRLAKLYQMYEHYANLYGRRYLDLKDWLEKEAGGEQERAQRRLLLADPAQAERAALLQSQIVFFENALETLRAIEAGEEPDATRKNAV